ncbi:cyanoexosortase A [Aphanothece hegewaldii CCALA 016]|uniref:Cyanoexosortase A n=1 Tax=Aphanothece hegewaldii CCALA 016 TaxID=2107694 RepID=A0A2T1M027_9CHRO|nr:cyanoexosortase A [Aphanothece hegewaldii]PSF37980.1 cyanoexosortase A [Aphanothece hegewaldii CCALA 016]
MEWTKYLQKSTYWLLALGVALATLHLTILDRSSEPNLMSLSILLWLAIGSLLWDKRHNLHLESDFVSTLVGFSLIMLILLRGLAPSGYHLKISPFVSGVGLALMASGVKRLYDYWKELLILGLLVLYTPFANILQAIDLPLLTAKVSTFILWFNGFNVYREGVNINLPTGKVEVYGACSGIDSILLMFNIAVLFFLLIPIKPIQRIVCLVLAIILGFIVNAFRVALMAILVAARNTEAFEYWHGNDGSLIFSVIGVVLFGLFCWFAYVRPFATLKE